MVKTWQIQYIFIYIEGVATTHSQGTVVCRKSKRGVRGPWDLLTFARGTGS